MSTVIHGRCHCGNVQYHLETAQTWADVTLRVCRCEFCLRHRPRYWSDPAGQIRVSIATPSDILRYRFGHGTADFIICRRCGVFCFAVAEIEGAYVVVANLNLALTREQRPEEAFIEALDEDEPRRNARRRANWTPLAGPWPP